MPPCRPINRILLAQRITLPQMWVSVLVVLLHAGANWLFIYHLRWGYLGAAWATSLVRAQQPTHAGRARTPALLHSPHQQSACMLMYLMWQRVHAGKPQWSGLVGFAPLPGALSHAACAGQPEQPAAVGGVPAGGRPAAARVGRPPRPATDSAPSQQHATRLPLFTRPSGRPVDSALYWQSCSSTRALCWQQMLVQVHSAVEPLR